MGVKSLDFKNIEIQDRDIIHKLLWEFNLTGSSDLTFTNLFIWRKFYNIKWSIYNSHLLLISDKPDGFAFPPIGPPSRKDVSLLLLNWMKKNGFSNPSIQRADKGLADELKGICIIEPTLEHFDYVYSCKSLISLQGKNYHNKRSNIKKFVSNYKFDVQDIDSTNIQGCLELERLWCDIRHCEEDMNLIGEWSAIKEIFNNFKVLRVKGCVIIIDKMVEGFSVGEILNNNTVVVHVEKANPEFQGIYSVINQQFCIRQTMWWKNIEWINREQDLGNPGLRQAKQSYFPDHRIEKYMIRECKPLTING
jgi:hypothetical protein